MSDEPQFQRSRNRLPGPGQILSTTFAPILPRTSRTLHGTARTAPRTLTDSLLLGQKKKKWVRDVIHRSVLRRRGENSAVDRPSVAPRGAVRGGPRCVRTLRG